MIDFTVYLAYQHFFSFIQGETHNSDCRILLSHSKSFWMSNELISENRFENYHAFSFASVHLHFLALGLRGGLPPMLGK